MHPLHSLRSHILDRVSINMENIDLRTYTPLVRLDLGGSTAFSPRHCECLRSLAS
jgi:hypothetical protein